MDWAALIIMLKSICKKITKKRFPFFALSFFKHGTQWLCWCECWESLYSYLSNILWFNSRNIWSCLSYSVCAISEKPHSILRYYFLSILTYSAVSFISVLLWRFFSVRLGSNYLLSHRYDLRRDYVQDVFRTLKYLIRIGAITGSYQFWLKYFPTLDCSMIRFSSSSRGENPKKGSKTWIRSVPTTQKVWLRILMEWYVYFIAR